MFIPCRRCGKDSYIRFICAHAYCPECYFEWCEDPEEDPNNWKARGIKLAG